MTNAAPPTTDAADAYSVTTPATGIDHLLAVLLAGLAAFALVLVLV